MTFDRVLYAITECEKKINETEPRFDLFCAKDVEQLNHCLDMIRRMREWPPERIEKAFRWLGFIQGVLWTLEIADLEELKAMNWERESAT